MVSGRPRPTDMKLIFETEDLEAYLQESDVIDFHVSPVREKIEEIADRSPLDVERARMAFEYARDQISHSFDLQDGVVTVSASQAMACHEGICFAKAHVLAALLRGLKIPTGFCYQRVTRKGTPESGYALHGLNAVYLPSRRVWFRLDPRGNKPGVNSQFCIETEQLAYTIHPEMGEVDYPCVFTAPLPEVLAAMRDSTSVQELFFNRPPALDCPNPTKP